MTPREFGGWLSILAATLAIATTARGESGPKGEFARQYFAAWVATQQPDATPETLEKYLELLSDDVGYEHKPHRVLDADTTGGRQRMREGMTFYLGKNEGYQAELTSIVQGPGVVAIEYRGTHAFRRGGEGPVLNEAFTAVDVLEIIDGKVAIIRHYRE